MMTAAIAASADGVVSGIVPARVPDRSADRQPAGSALLRLAIAAACSIAACPAAFPADLADEANSAFIRDSEVTLHLRSYYLDRRRPAPAAESEAWAGGGWLGYRSGWLADLFRVGVTGYTSQRIWAPPETDGTLLLKPGQESYSVVGEAYAALKLWDQVFTGYRQLVDLPEVNPQDNRMTPNTFQGYTLAGKFGPTSYFAGYLDKMKTRNDDEFRDFATVAGAPAGMSEGMWLGGLTFAPHERLVLRLSSYRVANVLASTYADGEWRMPLAPATELRLGAQYMYQSSTGDNVLTGRSFHVGAGGVKADLQRGAATLTVAYTQTGRGEAYRSPYGTWAGLHLHDRGGLQSRGRDSVADRRRLRFRAATALPGLSAFVNAVFGDRALDPVTRAPLSDKTEYDATLDYRFSGAWPAWLKPLWVRLRAVRVEEKTAGGTGVTNDYRVIVNYERIFK